MKRSINWTRDLISGTHRIFSYGLQIGTIIKRPFSQVTMGDINGKSYVFIPRGFFGHRVSILEEGSGVNIGYIQYNSWMTRAEISIMGVKYNWRYTNITTTRFTINGSNVDIDFANGVRRGSLVTNCDNDILHLTGIFTINYYAQLSFASLLIILLPVWIVIFK